MDDLVTVQVTFKVRNIEEYEGELYNNLNGNTYADVEDMIFSELDRDLQSLSVKSVEIVEKEDNSF